MFMGWDQCISWNLSNLVAKAWDKTNNVYRSHNRINRTFMLADYANHEARGKNERKCKPEHSFRNSFQQILMTVLLFIWSIAS